MYAYFLVFTSESGSPSDGIRDLLFGEADYDVGLDAAGQTPVTDEQGRVVDGDKMDMQEYDYRLGINASSKTH
jgi:hypothetical protein